MTVDDLQTFIAELFIEQIVILVEQIHRNPVQSTMFVDGSQTYEMKENEQKKIWKKMRRTRNSKMIFNHWQSAERLSYRHSKWNWDVIWVSRPQVFETERVTGGRLGENLICNKHHLIKNGSIYLDFLVRTWIVRMRANERRNEPKYAFFRKFIPKHPPYAIFVTWFPMHNHLIAVVVVVVAMPERKPNKILEGFKLQ